MARQRISIKYFGQNSIMDLNSISILKSLTGVMQALTGARESEFVWFYRKIPNLIRRKYLYN